MSHIPPEYDRRVKLTPSDKVRIRSLFNDDHVAIREIARRYEKICSRRAIQFVIYPERRALCAAQFKERRKDGRYLPERTAWAATMREHRHYKQSIKNKLI
jgi:hypothetical protein